MGNFPGTNKTVAQGGQLNYTHIFTPRLLMELRTGVTRIKIDSETIDSGTNASTKLGIANADIPSQDPRATGFTSLHFLDGSADLGDQIAYPIVNVNDTFQWNGDVIYNRGAHNIKLGAALIRRQLNYLQEFEPEGWLFFLSPVAMAEGVPAVFLARQNQYSFEYLRTWEPNFFVQDDWRALPNLTINFGVRYDVFSPFTEAKNRISNFDPASLSLLIGGTGGISTDHGDVAPRIGFSYQAGHDFLLRGGFGTSYYPGDFASAIQLSNPPYANPISCSPIAGSCGMSSTGAPLGLLSTGIPSSSAYVDPSIIYSPAAGGLNLVAKERNWRAAYLEQYNLTIQKQIGANVLNLGYVGSLGRRQITSDAGQDLNLPFPSSNGTYQVVGGNVPHYYAAQLPGITEITYYANEFTSNYNSLQTSFERRSQNGLTFNVNYTYAHGLNDWSGFTSGGAPAEWRGNPRYDYGNSDLDVRHRIAGTLVYEIPYGKTLTGFEGVALKGWAVSSSAFWQTGLPFTVADSNKPGGAFGDFSQSIRPNVVAGQSFYEPHKSANGYINPSAFSPAWTGSATATTFTLGNEGSNQLSGPHLRQADLAFYKTQQIRENLRMQFRAESFNISNTENFAQPANDLNAPATFGQILSTQQGFFGRQFQFALKLLF